MIETQDALTLNNEDLAFIRMLGELFPNLESPLRFIEDEDLEPQEPEDVFKKFEERVFWDEKSAEGLPYDQDHVYIHHTSRNIRFHHDAEDNRADHQKRHKEDGVAVYQD